MLRRAGWRRGRVAAGEMTTAVGDGAVMLAPVPDDGRPTSSSAAGGSPPWTRPRRVAEALAVVDGRIAAVGTDAALRRWIGPRTRVIDLRGRTVTPGFGDAHVHPVTSGLDRLRCDLTGARGLTAYLEVIAAYAASHPDEAWIRGSGWSMADFPGGIAGPRRSRPDRARPARYLENRDGHTALGQQRGAGAGRDHGHDARSA